MDTSRDREVATVTTTIATRAEGQALARAILDARLAACVQLEEGLTSCYRWEGKVCEDAEVRLTIKTVPACVPALRELFRRAHPYALPQFVAWTGEGSEAYAAWVREEVNPATPGQIPAR
ncbi:MAG TPA: divalent-cation tolerance protein CutA [Ramlibacter sp.]|nr:divalent-cation tolerance protein CutA [Ramlibacter sp.]